MKDVIIVRGNKGAGIGLSSAVMTYRVRELFKKKVICDYKVGDYKNEKV